MGLERDRYPGLSTRRQLLKKAAALGAASPLLGSAFLAACGGSGGNGQAPADSSATVATSGATEGAPVRGGRLTVGFVGGGAAETLDPSLAIASIDAGRLAQIFDYLTVLGPDLQLEYRLAESIEPNSSATEWTIRLRDGVTWHDGKPLTADDVMYTFRRIGAPESTNAGVTTVANWDLDGMEKLDPLTVRLPLRRPFADLPSVFTDFWWAIVQDGASDFTKPVGTGPFVFDSLTAGQASLFTRNPDYWMEGLPYVDELELQSIPDATARLNALVGGQIHAAENLGFAQAKDHIDRGDIGVLVGNGPAFTPIVMSTQRPPFTDVRVRQAMRLIADRTSLVENVQLGLGGIGNDLYGKGLKFYNDQLPQREQDLEQARSLLTQAGQENLQVTLASSAAGVGMLESATVFAEQARAAGVTVTIDNAPPDTFWVDKYMKTAFFQSQWGAAAIPVWFDQALVPGGIWNETSWDSPGFEARVRDAQGELDEAKATDKWFSLQEELWSSGGYLIWGHFPWIDGVATSVSGVTPSEAFYFGNFDFKNWWLQA